MNKYQEALDLMKMQIQHTEQNLAAFETLQACVDLMWSIHQDDGPTLTLRDLEKELNEFFQLDDGTVCRNYDEEDE